MLIAGYAFRYEPPWMVEQLRENLSWVDGFVEYDTRNAGVTWVPALDRTRVLHRKALKLSRQHGDSCWFFQTAPDERLEDGAAEIIRAATDRLPLARYTVHLRELWTPDEYRVDGIWGEKRRRRLYQIGPGIMPMGLNETIDLDVNLYHLKMIEPDNRRRRRDVFTDHNTWDNKRHGFDYLTDEQGMVLERIPPGRGYSPPYRTYEFSVPGYQ